MVFDYRSIDAFKHSRKKGPKFYHNQLLKFLEDPVDKNKIVQAVNDFRYKTADNPHATYPIQKRSYRGSQNPSSAVIQEIQTRRDLHRSDCSCDDMLYPGFLPSAEWRLYRHFFWSSSASSATVPPSYQAQQVESAIAEPGGANV